MYAVPVEDLVQVDNYAVYRTEGLSLLKTKSRTQQRRNLRYSIAI